MEKLIIDMMLSENIKEEELTPFMDATDALAAAYCHFLQSNAPTTSHTYRSWKDFINKNKEKIHA